MRRFSGIFAIASLFLFSTAVADVQKGWDAYNSLDYATAKSEWESLADSGDAEAAYGMGLLYGNGFGVDMNDDLAIRYYKIAADQGLGDAAFNLAVMHQNGWGVPMDEVKANEWYAVAADKGNTEAQMALGRYYAMDFLDSYDPVVAYKWFSIAAKLGDIDGSAKREFIEARMTEDQLAQARAAVDSWVNGHEALFADN